MTEQSKPVATISRRQIYATPGRNYRFAWRYIYDVVGPQGENICAGADTLAFAVSVATRKGYSIVRAWEGR